MSKPIFIIIIPSKNRVDPEHLKHLSEMLNKELKDDYYPFIFIDNVDKIEFHLLSERFLDEKSPNERIKILMRQMGYEI